MTWRSLAACRGLDPNLFFPHRSSKQDFRAAAALCAECPVAIDCWVFSQTQTDEHQIDDGIWGGVMIVDARTAAGRRRIRVTTNT